MLYINEQRIGGHLGKDAEIRPNPKADRGWFVILRVATTKRWKDSTGAKREETTWHDVELYTTFEAYCDFLRDKAVKGALVYVVGETRHDDYVGSDGVKRNRTLVRCDSLQIVSPPVDREDNRPASAAATPTAHPLPTPTPTPTPAPTPAPQALAQAHLGPAPRDMDFG
ncbi:single-stranded DNA-binding protein [Aquimonas sp.]|jgi:single-strand DNA-binding protein|uniref:single-stranded DNA-binding protein n=1 Tax=Aquimonas sp. TaxID=1872588 RepID=UPI0037BF698F